MLNLDANDDDSDTDMANGRFNALATHAVNALNSPGIIVVLGNMNELEFISPINTILGSEASLSNLIDGAQFDIVHVNSKFAETPIRASDHAPLLLTLSFESATTLNAADLNADGTVNARDYKLFVRSLGFREGQRRYRADADFDGNGRINRRDLKEYLLKYREVLVTLARGDIDRDADIDNRDRRLLFRSFGYRAGDRRYNPDADPDNNNRVNTRNYRQFIQLGH